MTAEAGVTELTLESTLESVEVAEEVAHRVCVEAGFDEEEQHKIEMAVHESVINAVTHGNRQDANKKVYLRFEIANGRLEIRIRDQGAGFDLSHVPDPLAAENLLKVSGRGIFLIRTFMDEFEVKSVKGSGTEVTMVKRIESKVKDTQGGTRP
ncbi:MAG TPA: ATP-binding protein [Terriglobia bacterium]|nr:ATP-binding protein [Terriglobia bacterium]